MKQIVTGHPLMFDQETDAMHRITEQFSMLIRENAELQAKIEGYEKYVKILEGQIKIVENIILKNIK